MCRKCNQNNPSISLRIRKQKKEVNFACDYNREQVQIWKQKLLCIKEKDYYSQVNMDLAKVNKYLGIANSILIYQNDPCLFESDLDELYLIITAIDIQNICQT